MTRNLSKLSATRRKKNTRETTSATQHRIYFHRIFVCIAPSTHHAHVSASHAVMELEIKSNAKIWERKLSKNSLETLFPPFSFVCVRHSIARVYFRMECIVVSHSKCWWVTSERIWHARSLQTVKVCDACVHRRRLIFSLNWGDVVRFTSHLWCKNLKTTKKNKKSEK